MLEKNKACRHAPLRMKASRLAWAVVVHVAFFRFWQGLQKWYADWTVRAKNSLGVLGGSSREATMHRKQDALGRDQGTGTSPIAPHWAALAVVPWSCLFFSTRDSLTRRWGSWA